jgi:HlyD family secretion protein
MVEIEKPKNKKPKRRDPNKVRNIVVLIVVVAVLTAASIYAVKNQTTGSKNKLKPLQETEEVKKGNMTISVKATGNLEPWDKIDLRPEASGKVEKLLVEAGDTVTKGQPVAILDQKSQVNSLERAKANVELNKAQLDEAKKGYRDVEKISLEDSISKAKLALEDADREFKRVKELYDKGFASRKEYDQAKTVRDQAEQVLKGLNEQLKRTLAGGEKESVKRAQAAYQMSLTELKEAERLLGDATVVSPMNGVVLQRYVSEGSVILSGLSTFSQGEAMFTIGDVSKMKLVAQVDEGDVGKVKVGQTALIEVDAYPDEKFQGKVTRIAPQGKADQSVMTTFGVEIEIPNADGRLKSGFTADVEIVVDEVKDVVLTPFRSVLEKDSKFYVWVVDKDDFVEEREIKVGKTNYDSYEVLSGLKVGEKVVTKGRPNKLKSDKGSKDDKGKSEVQVQVN